MELASYVEHLRRDLSEAAAAGGPEAQEAAQRLAMALDPAVRMTLLEALSDASAEITGVLEDTSIEVRMKGRDPEFVVEHLEPVASSAAEEAQPEEAESEDEGLGAGDETLARVTVRIPESVKARAEELASAGSQSLNAWIVQAIRFAARERAINIDIDLGSRLFAPGAPPPPPPPPGAPSPPGVRVRMPRHVQGWSR